MDQRLDREFPNLTENNIRLYAAKAYDSPTNITAELDEDYARFKFLKRALRRYRKTGCLTPLIILNHMIVMRNVFGTAFVRMLFLKIDQEDWPALKTYLSYMSSLPLVVRGVNNVDLDVREIPWDAQVVAALRKL